MKIQSRYYPIILIAAFVIFLLTGLLLGLGPEHGSEAHGAGALMIFAIAGMRAIP
jgi:hypothetical protein